MIKTRLSFAKTIKKKLGRAKPEVLQELKDEGNKVSGKKQKQSETTQCPFMSVSNAGNGCNDATK